MNRTRFLGLMSLLVAVGFSGCIVSPRPTDGVYPQQNQSAVQLAQDKSACRAWAEKESG